MSENLTACPCQSGNHYADCCQPLHAQTAFATSAEQLMRSRYAAFVKHQIGYIVQTTVPSQQALLNIADIESWAKQTVWLGLEIVESEPKLDKTHARVSFNAFYQGEEGRETHYEQSIFTYIDGRWYFFDPTVPRPSNKQPCVCGSTQKFKHCCGRF